MVAPSLRCFDCGLEYPDDTPGGHCPRCLFGLALTPDPSDELKLPFRGVAPEVYFSGYRILGEIARGGVGVVYRARQIEPSREVALKMLQAGALASPDARLRFEMEIGAVARLSHPNIVALYETGNEAGVLFFTMKFLPGGSLADKLKVEPALPDEAQLRERVRFLAKVCAGVEHAHLRGLLHRDLKPSNIMFDENGEPVVTDFGLVKMLESDSNLTLSQAFIGSPNYMPPEQASSGAANLTTAADIYGLGAILYELATCLPPFVAGTPVETMRQVVNEIPKSLKKQNPAVDSDLERVCLKCLEKEPHARYHSAEEFAADLERWLDHRPVHARPRPPLVQGWFWCRRHPALAAGLAMLPAVAIGAVFAAYKIEAANVRTDRMLVRMQLEKAESFLEEEKVGEGLAMFAHVLRGHPKQEGIARRLYAELTSRRFAIQDQVPRRHGSQMCAVVVSPDGHSAVTVSRLGSAWRWDLTAAPGAPPEILFTFSEPILDAAVAPDGRSVLLRKFDQELILWSAHVFRSLGKAEGADDPGFDPSGRYAMAVVDWKKLRVWDAAAEGELIREYVHEGVLHCWATSPDLRLVVSGQVDGNLCVWDTDEGKLIRTIATGRGNIGELAFDPSGRYLGAGNMEGRLQVWDTRSWKPIEMQGRHTAPLTHLEFSPDGGTLLSSSFDGTARLSDTRTGKEKTPPLRHEDFVHKARFNSDGTRVVTASEDNTSRLWDASTGLPLTHAMQHGAGVADVSFGAGEGRLVTATYSGFLWGWSVRAPFFQETPLQSDEGIAVAALAGEHIIAGGSNGTLGLWDAAGGEQISHITNLGGAVATIAASPKGDLFATYSTDGDHVRVFDVASLSPVSPALDHGVWRVGSIAFSPSGETLLTGASDGCARLWDWKAGELLFTTNPPSNEPTNAVEFSRDGTLFLTSSRYTVEVRETATRKLLASRNYAGIAEHVVFSPDGDSVAVGGSRNITILASKTLVGESGFPHPSQITGISFSKDSSKLLTGCTSGFAYLWSRAKSDSPSGTFALRGGVAITRFSRDESMVLTISSKGKYRLWDALSGRPLSSILKHGAMVSDARFLPADRGILFVSTDGAATIAPVPVTNLGRDTGGWLPDLVEIVSKSRVNEDGIPEGVPFQEHATFRCIVVPKLSETGGSRISEHLFPESQTFPHL